MQHKPQETLGVHRPLVQRARVYARTIVCVEEARVLCLQRQELLFSAEGPAVHLGQHVVELAMEIACDLSHASVLLSSAAAWSLVFREGLEGDEGLQQATNGRRGRRRSRTLSSGCGLVLCFASDHFCKQGGVLSKRAISLGKKGARANGRDSKTPSFF